MPELLPNWLLEIKLRYHGVVRGGELFLQKCPYCRNSKWNFQINIYTYVTHCWVCGAGGSVEQFMREQGIEYDRDELRLRRDKNKKQEEPQGAVTLPENRPLIMDTSVAGIQAKSLLYKRHVSDILIKDWDLRLALDDNWFGYILAPFYNVSGLAYYMGIGFMDGTMKYRFPPKALVSKDKFMPKQRGSDSLILVEGFFDGTSAWQNTHYDVWILLGKFLLKRQTIMLKRANYKNVFVCLDGDALLDIAKLSNRLFREGLPLRAVQLPREDDPDDVGAGLQHYLDAAEPVTGVTKSRLRRQLIRERLHGN